MSNLLQCALCKMMVPEDETLRHLASLHPTPDGGFEFFLNGERFITNEPSMYVANLLALAGRSEICYIFYEERGEERVDHYYSNAVDLTNGPRHFFYLPPARW